MAHTIFLILSVVASVGLIAATARTAYIAGNPGRLKEQLAKYKDRTEQERGLMGRVYSRKFVYALCLESAWAVLFAVSSLIDVLEGQATVVSMVLSGIGLLCGIAGVYTMSRILKDK